MDVRWKIYTAIAAIVSGPLLVAHNWPDVATRLAGPATLSMVLVTAFLAYSTAQLASSTRVTLDLEKQRSYALPIVTSGWGWVDEDSPEEAGAVLEVNNLGTIRCRLTEIHLKRVSWKREFDLEGYPDVVGIEPEKAIRISLDDVQVSGPPGWTWGPKDTHVVTVRIGEYIGSDLAGIEFQLVFDNGDKCHQSIQPQLVKAEGQDD